MRMCKVIVPVWLTYELVAYVTWLHGSSTLTYLGQ